ncbi:MAG: helix-turn-helix transcriptional regulator [Parvibaculum sp.]|nr:helix-turn-helix transcriptional regulator [Parvibaculum sp.]
MSVAERLSRIRKYLGLSQKDMGRRVAVSGTTWQNYELDNAAPNAHVLARLSDEGFDINWVLTGAGEMRKDGALETKSVAGFAELPPREIGREKLAGGNYVLIPRYALRALPREGGSAATTMEDVSLNEALAFRRDWIERELGARPADLIVVEMTDDAMLPTLVPGDLLLVDTSAPRMRGGGLYAFNLGGALAVRRLQARLDGGLTVSSDNAALYPPEDIEQAALERVKIVGRVVWRAGRL